MENKLLVFIYRENEFVKYQIIDDSEPARKRIDAFNKSDTPETTKIVVDEDIRQAIFQKESIETIKDYVDSVREDIEEIRDNVNNLDYSLNDFYRNVKNYLNVDENTSED
jgi:hypothetical protein